MDGLDTNKNNKERLYKLEDAGHNIVFDEISLEQIPQNVAAVLLEKSGKESRFRGTSMRQWSRMARTDYGNITTYLASSTVNDLHLESTYLFDVLKDEIVGEGRIVKSMQGDDSRNPMPSWTTTHESSEKRHQGLGERRLAVMNAFGLKYYGLPLHSSYGISKSAYGLWKKLASQGRARIIEEKDIQGRNSFEFIA